MELLIGTDIIAVDRIKQAISGWKMDFLQRVFTFAEIAQINADSPDYERAAGFWAAKESMVKAMGCGFQQGVCFHNMEINHNSAGAPSMTLDGRLKQLFDMKGEAQIALSISHCRTYAIAVVAIIAHH